MHHDDTSERWLPVEGFPGYEVSDYGRMYSSKAHNGQQGRILKPRISRNHVAAMFWQDGKRYYRYVHRLVLMAFVGPPPEGMSGAHLDGDPFNNHVSNLAWVTHAENMAHMVAHGTRLKGERAPGSKMTQEQVDEARELARQGWTRWEIAPLYGVSAITIYSLLTGRHWLD